MGDDRDLGLAWLGRGLVAFRDRDRGFPRVLLFLDQPIEQRTEDVGQVLGTGAGVGAIGIVSGDVSVGWPIEADAKAHALVALEHAGTQVLITVGGILPANIVAVNEEGDVRLVFMLRGVDLRKLIGRSDEQRLKLISATRCQAMVPSLASASAIQ